MGSVLKKRMDGNNAAIVTATRDYVWHKWRIFILFIPVVAYAILTSINNIFGVDFTNGWMGDRDPVGAGYVLLAGTPFFAYSLFRCLQEVFLQTPNILILSDWGVVIKRYPKRQYPWESVNQIRLLSDGREPELAIFLQNEKEARVPIRYLDASPETLLRLFADHGQTIKLQ